MRGKNVSTIRNHNVIVTPCEKVSWRLKNSEHNHKPYKQMLETVRAQQSFKYNSSTRPMSATITERATVQSCGNQMVIEVVDYGYGHTTKRNIREQISIKEVGSLHIHIAADG
jgi:hypothetical protein